MRGILIRLGKNLTIFVVIFVTIFSFSQIASLPAVALAEAGASSITSDKIIELTNQKRIENGLTPLSFSSELSVSAQNKAIDLVKRNYWSHETPEGLPFWSFVNQQNYDWLYLGENLAADFETSEGIVNAWSRSDSHRKNILNENYQDIGVGISENIVVTIYGQQSKFQLSPLKKIPKFFLNFYLLLLNF